MRFLPVVCWVAAASCVWAASDKLFAQSAASLPMKGEVIEVRNVQNYTYLRLKTTQGDMWAAIPAASVAKGAAITIENPVVIRNFHSEALKTTFSTIAFGTMAAAPGSGAQIGKELATAHTSVARPPEQDGDLRVPKATGANARTVAEVMTRPGDLKDKPVLLRGKVVKYNAAIMGKNWLHLRDGTGSAADKTNDMLVTTSNEAKVGDIVTVKGVVRTDRDFSLGYSYKALIEEATLQK